MRLYITTLLTALIFTACSLVDDPMEPCPVAGRGDDIMLSFELLTPGGSITSRADDDPSHSEVAAELSALENGIDYSDIAVFVYIYSPASSTYREVVRITDVTSSGITDRLDIIGSPGSYTVNVTITKEQYKNLTGNDLDASSAEKVNFRIMMIANGAVAASPFSGITATEFEAAVAQLDAAAYDYSMALLYKDVAGVNEATGLYGQVSKKHLPMWGTNTFSVSQQALIESRPENRLFLGSVNLLRAVAKVRVEDNIRNRAEGYPCIKSVEFIGTQDAVKLLPSGASTYIDGNQVHSPNIAAPANPMSLSASSLYTYRLGTIPARADLTPAGQNHLATFVAYVPEQKIDVADNDVNSGLPVIRITAALSADDTGKEMTKTYDVPMTRFGEMEFDFGSSLLRNHIYTLEVTRVNTSKLDFNVAVNNWRNIAFDYEY